jgi:2-C-methyl-D-erythritol 2,4-cyclodiphosphate synthase
MEQKIGIGYDIHRLVPGRKLFLGGVEIPHDKGLDGHSDADVLLHALCDAILGALGAGDIGEHFPNTDEKYRGISSVVLLSEVAKVMRGKSFEVANVDTVVIAQEPNLASFKAEMRAQIAKRLGIEEENVNIKATTAEGVGPIGNKEAIAAYAVVLLVKGKG